MNPLFILGGALFGAGLLAQALGERGEKVVMWGGALIAAVGLFVSVKPVRLGGRR